MSRSQSVTSLGLLNGAAGAMLATSLHKDQTPIQENYDSLYTDYVRCTQRTNPENCHSIWVKMLLDLRCKDMPR